MTDNDSDSDFNDDRDIQGRRILEPGKDLDDVDLDADDDDDDDQKNEIKVD